jgi:hypothetical protein
MGFLVPKPPAAARIEPTAAPSNDDQRVRQAANNARDRALARRDSADTMRGSGGARRRTGGLAAAMRDTVGG